MLLMELNETLSGLDEDLTYWSLVKNQVSSVWDLLSGDPLKGIDPAEVFCKPKPKKSNISPQIKIRDLNNSESSPKENKPKTAIEIGVKLEF